MCASLFAVSEESLATIRQMKDYVDRYDHFSTDRYGRPRFDTHWGEQFEKLLVKHCSVLSECLASDLSKAICSKQPTDLKAKCNEKRHSFCNKCLVTKDSLERLLYCENQRIRCRDLENKFYEHFSEMRIYLDAFTETHRKEQEQEQEQEQEKQKEIEGKKIQVPPPEPNQALEKSVHEGDDLHHKEKQ